MTTFELDFETATTQQLMDIVDETYEELKKTGTVRSLSDFEEAVRELTLREGA